MSNLRLRRLWQPSRLLFWMMVGFNALSSVCSFAMRALPLNTLGLVVVGVVGLINVACGLWAAWQLVKEPAPGEKPAEKTAAAK
jgi:4-hydroxybenzoate polyprenyltransferase